ncbi:MAG: GerMN domain-containing protein [Mollicutes bacterium]|nr:GerMN domain-containing protein [Mollicutes bacterium]
MIKKYAMNKIFVSTLIFGLLLLFYLVPSPSFEVEINEKDDNKEFENVVYLLDDDNYVSRVISYYDETDIDKVIRNKINILINGDKNLNNFYSLIPKKTILKDISVNKDNVYLNFSKEFLNVNKYIEESMVESIVYTLTEINGINNVYINVDGEKFVMLPNSKKVIPYPLTRSFGINKKYDLDSLNDIDKTIVYFVKKNDSGEYYVPITKVSNLSSSKIDIIIDELKSTVNAQDNLSSFISDNVVLEENKIIDDKINLVFNEYIFSDSSKKTILEEVKYVVSQSIFDNLDVKEVIFSTKEHNNIVSIKKK